MSKLAVFGATGGTGRMVVSKALSAGHEVVALARTPSGVDPRVHTVIEGDVRDAEAVARTLEGVDAAIVVLGMPARDRSRLREEGTRTIVEAMKAQGVSRLVVMSVLGAHESRQGLDWVTTWLVFPLWLKHAIRDHEAQEEVVRASGLDYTLVRPPHLTDKPGMGSWTVDFDMTASPPAMTVPREDVAAFLVWAAVRRVHVGEAVGIVATTAAARAA